MMLPKCCKNGWCHKLTALAIVTAYFILLIFVNNSSYIWATLALIFVLFVTTFACASKNSPLLLQLRGTRLGEISSRTIAEERTNDTTAARNQESPSAQHTRIWMTDIPPSYSVVMDNAAPQTPPPSYGSAILMFPPPYIEITKADGSQEQVQVQEITSTPRQGHRRFRPLSISTQVSVTSAPQTPQIGTISFSTQISLANGVAEAFSDTVSLRTQLFLSRQASREELAENDDSRSQAGNAIEVRNYEIPIFYFADDSDSYQLVYKDLENQPTLKDSDNQVETTSQDSDNQSTSKNSVKSENK